MGSHHRRLLTIAIAFMLAMGLAAPSTGAATCDAHAHDWFWGGSTNPDPNCAIGYGYDTAANYITGTQRILKGLNYYGGSIDGYWGPLSDGATKN